MMWLIAGTLLIGLIAIFMLVFKVMNSVNQQLSLVTQQVNERLNQVSLSLQESNRSLAQGLGNATTLFGGIQEKLGKLEVTNLQIIDISKNISSLQELLRAPKFRGEMGETLLENLLSQVLPREHFESQYRFKSGDVVDAVIKLGERMVPIDAKFSLENFQKMVEAPEEATKSAFRKKFIQDVKHRVEEVALKYILPAENTFDFALMYIPAENVYYEVAVKEDLLSYFISKKVIPVSPNSFYAYLQVICIGLKGMKVEENAKQILKNLSALNVELAKFRDDFDTLGKHMGSATAKYADAEKRLGKFSDRLTGIQDARQIEGV